MCVIMTRRMRSSRSSSVEPRRAAATVGYRAHAAAIFADEPRRIVAINLNMCWISPITVSFGRVDERCTGLNSASDRDVVHL